MDAVKLWLVENALDFGLPIILGVLLLTVSHLVAYRIGHHAGRQFQGRLHVLRVVAEHARIAVGWAPVPHQREAGGD